MDIDQAVETAKAALKRAEKATRGPWSDEHHRYDTIVSVPLDLPVCEKYRTRDGWVDDLIFISAARTDVPELAQAVIELAEELNRRPVAPVIP